MRPWSEAGSGGNPSSLHARGRAARQALEDARDQVAAILHCRARDVIFTSGATEANTLALRGGVSALGPKAGLIVSRLEHPSVTETAERLEREGRVVDWIDPDPAGAITPKVVADAWADETPRVLAVMLANNEIGHVTDVAAIVRSVADRGVQVHTDATQALGHMSVDFRALGVDTLSFSAHKLGGPLGVGVLVARRESRLGSLVVGGTQELGRRAGTENVAGAVGCAAALKESVVEMESRIRRWHEMRSMIETQLTSRPDVVINSTHPNRLPHLVNASFKGVEGEALLVCLDMEGVAVSSGSACHADDPEPSHVLRALGRSRELAAATVRFSLGATTTTEDVNQALNCLESVLSRLKRTTKH